MATRLITSIRNAINPKGLTGGGTRTPISPTRTVKNLGVGQGRTMKVNRSIDKIVRGK